MTCRPGYTLTELLVVIAIVAVLTAIALPIVGGVKRSAHIRGSMSNLRQIWLATATYRSDHDGDGRYGDLDATGLPSSLFLMLDRLDTPLDIWKSPCGVHPDQPESVIHYIYWPGMGGPEFAATCEAYRENTILLYDPNCTPPDIPLHNVYQSRRGLGVLLGGQLVNRFRTGSMSDPSFWSDPAP